MNALNLEQIRAEFPAPAGVTVCLDNAGGSQVLRRVADRVHDDLLTSSEVRLASQEPAIEPGDEIIVTESDHEANIGAWMRLQQAGAVIKVWQVDRDSLVQHLDEVVT